MINSLKRVPKAKFSAKTTSGSVGTAIEEKKKAKKRKLEEKQSISNIDIYIYDFNSPK